MKRAHIASSTAVVTDPYNFVVPGHLRSEALSGDTSITLTATIIYFDVQTPVSGVLFVKYGDIYHIEHHNPPFHTPIEEIELFLLDGSSCIIEAECSYRLSLCIMDLWHARLLQKSVKFKQMRNSTSKDLCMQYYYEILSSIRENKTIDNIIDVLDEVGKEIQSDMLLKEVVFQSVDLILLSLNLLKDLLSVVPAQSDKYVEDNRLRELYPFGLKGVSSHMLENASLTDELHTTLQATIGKRLKLIQKVLQFLLSLFFGAETLTCRSGVLLGPSPLDGASWNALLSPDLHKVIFSAFGCEDKENTDELENAELFVDPFAKYQSHYSKGSGVYLKPQPPSASPHSKLSPSPKGEDLMKSLTLTNTKNSKVNELIIKELPSLRKSIRSMQLKLFYDLYEVQQSDKALAVPTQIRLADKNPIEDPMIIQSKEHSKAGKLKAYVSIGTLFTKTFLWENVVENFMAEIADDLDQVMAKVKTKKSTKSFSSKPTTTSIDSSASFLPPIALSPRAVEDKKDMAVEQCEDDDFNIAHHCVPRIFCITEVLHSLALDSFKVREVLGNDVKAMWTSIDSVFSALCDGKDLSKTASLVSAPPSISVKGNFKLRESRQNSALLPPISTNYAADALNSSTEFVRSSYSNIKNSLLPDNMGHFGRESHNTDTPKRSRPQSFRSIEERNQMFPNIPFPKHGFSKYEWMLIMEARSNVLKTMQLVGVRTHRHSERHNVEIQTTNDDDDNDDNEEEEEDALILDSPKALIFPQTIPEVPEKDPPTAADAEQDVNDVSKTPIDIGDVENNDK